MPDQEPKVLECHKCQKRLKYSGKKPYINCPGCGESIPVVDNIQEDGTVHEVVDTPPVESVWHVARGDERFGPFTNEQLLQGISSGRISANDFLWESQMSEWKSAKTLFPKLVPPELPPAPVLNGLPSQSGAKSQQYTEFVAKKMAAGLCGILLGPLGVHKFIIGNNQGGTIMLCVSLCGLVGSILVLPIFAYLAMAVIGIVEGITYLTCSDADFYKNYFVKKKQWF